jgi:plastocyanin
MKRASLSALALIALAALVAGCGSSSSSSSSSSTSTTTSSEASTTAQTTPATSSTSAATTPAPSSSGGSSAQTLHLEANPEGLLQFNTTSLTAKAGKVTIDFANMSPVGHNVTVTSSGGSTLGATPTFQGATKTLTLNLKPGTYTFFCSVPGHAQAGMKGTLTVQ